jgi:hypothetical protein
LRLDSASAHARIDGCLHFLGGIGMLRHCCSRPRVRALQADLAAPVHPVQHRMQAAFRIAQIAEHVQQLLRIAHGGHIGQQHGHNALRPVEHAQSQRVQHTAHVQQHEVIVRGGQLHDGIHVRAPPPWHAWRFGGRQHMQIGVTLTVLAVRKRHRGGGCRSPHRQGRGWVAFMQIGQRIAKLQIQVDQQHGVFAPAPSPDWWSGRWLPAPLQGRRP